MPQPLVSWDDYRTVLAVSSARSLAGAADLLAVNQSTVFRRLGRWRNASAPASSSAAAPAIR